MALMSGTRGWAPRRGRKAMRSRTTPSQRRYPHAEKKSKEKIDLIGAQEQDGGKGPGHINFTLGEVD